MRPGRRCTGLHALGRNRPRQSAAPPVRSRWHTAGSAVFFRTEKEMTTMTKGRFMGRSFCTGPAADHANRRVRDEPERPQLKERKHDDGNRHYVLTLPPGSYDLEDDEGAG